ncbi:ABC transporter substrate-binding protein [Pseudoroseomonas globiformis]|uniref:ABC transporter substrate-binding protein n=1 Tax=Teichococcus globiformis TaxID=2307229 RepID=A0ABV7FT70_9PROT
MQRRSFCLSGLAAGAAALARPALGQSATGWPRALTDLLGRRVTLPAAPRAILLGEGFQLLSLALIHPDPVSLLVGTGGDLRQADPVMDAAFRRAFPALEQVPQPTTTVGQTLPVETALALRPDLIILAVWQFDSPEVQQSVTILERAGVPTLFVDTFQNPLTNTPRSIRLLGQALGREEQAEAYAVLYDARVARVRERVAAAQGIPPAVLLTAFPGRWPCCWAAGEGGAGEYLKALGARNVAGTMLPTPRGGTLGLEQILSLSPDVFIGTGLHRPGDEGGLILGSGASPERAQQSLREVLRAPELANLAAVKAGRAHGLWNYFSGTPLSFVGLEAMARWVRPELFADLDPAAALAEANRFTRVAFEGTYWTSLPPG